VRNPNLPKNKQGCEACHGPGKEHVEGGGDKTKIFAFKNASAKDISARCLGCHTYGEEHSNYARSAHLQNNGPGNDVLQIDVNGDGVMDSADMEINLVNLNGTLHNANFLLAP